MNLRKSIFWSTWPQHGPILVPKMAPSWVQSGVKIGPKSIKNRPGADLAPEAVFDPTWTPLWTQLGAILGPKMGPCWGQESIFRGSREQQKTDMIFNSLRGPLGADFGSLWGRSWNPKSIRNRSQEGSNKKTKIFQKLLIFP